MAPEPPSTMKRILQKIRYWWDARADEPSMPKPSPLSEFYVGNYYRYGLTRLLRGIISFYFRHWKWLWSAAIGAASVYTAALQLSCR